MISGVVVLELSVFCFTLTVIFHVQVEVHVEFTYLSVDGAEKLKVSVRTVAHILFQFSSK